MTNPHDEPATSAAPRRRPRTFRSRYVAALAVLGIGAAGAAVAATGASPADGAASKLGPRFKVHAVVAGGRASDLRVGEPLVMTYRGKKIGRICWNPAPIDTFRCSTAIAAPAKAGEQKLQLTFADGSKAYETLTIGPADTTLPVDPYSYAAVPGSHPVVMEATCTAQAYGQMSSGTPARALKGLQLNKGDKLAAYYRSGPHAIAGWGYLVGKAAFYDDRCLKIAG